MYQYHAEVIKVYDGDTITVNIDLGFGVWLKKQTIRLIGINTPEIRGDEREAGLVSRDRLRELILDKTILLVTRKDTKGKYGRWLGEIYPQNPDIVNYSESYNQQLLDEGLAKIY